MIRRHAWTLVLFAALAWEQPGTCEESYSFGVVPVRNALLSARYWNPILDYVERKSGVVLEFTTRKSSQIYSEAEAGGAFDFVYDNHIFAPSHTPAGYSVVLKPAGKPLHGQIAVAETSPLRTPRDLEDREMGFPNKDGFAGYAVPMAGLIQAGISVRPVFGGNQEGVMAQLRAGTIAAGGVNSRVLEEYGTREGFRYRVLWTSAPFLDIPIAVHPRVPKPVAALVRATLAGMAQDPEGERILKASAAIIGQEPPYGFVAAEDREYADQGAVYRLIWAKEGR